MNRISLMYEEYFQMLSDIYGKHGWNELHDDRTNLDWLQRQYNGVQV